MIRIIKLKSLGLLLAIMLFPFISLFSQNSSPTYLVKRQKKEMKIDGKWSKSQWRSAKTIRLTHFMGKIPEFRPKVKVKMMYDDDNLYLIFKVKDRYVRSIVENFNGPVSTDACVEFFFSPEIDFPKRYFNLEINAGGIPLMAYHTYGQKESKKFSIEDLKKIEIAHSLPVKVDPEITKPVTWTIEYKLPISVLRKYGNVPQPKAGVTWNANFYKTASKGNNIHYITWSYVDNEKPNFHLPQYFGKIEFGE